MVNKGLMPLGVLLSGIGFTYSLVYATQGVVLTFADLRRVVASVRRYSPAVQQHARVMCCCTAVSPCLVLLHRC